MITHAKLLAMCIGAGFTAPVAILTASPPARHAVAHVLHRAANHLEPHHVVKRAPASAIPAVPACVPVLFGPNSFADQPLVYNPEPVTPTNLPLISSDSQPQYRYPILYNTPLPFGNRPSIIGYPPVIIPPIPIIPVVIPPSPAPEPEIWLMMVVGFGLIGSRIRYWKLAVA